MKSDQSKTKAELIQELQSLRNRVYAQNTNKRTQAEEALLLSKRYYKTLFNYSPVPLWEEDFSELHTYLEELRERGVSDFRAYFDNNMTELQRCVEKVKIIDVNQTTLKLYNAKNKEELLGNLGKTFTQNSYDVFKEELISIASGQLEFESEAEVKTITGELRYIFLRLLVDKDQPGYKRALVVTTDITERKQVEEALHNIAVSFSSVAGVDFFNKVSKYLVDNLNVDYAFVGELVNEDRVRVVGGFGKGNLLEPFEYDLKDTPCENVVGQSLCCYSSDVQKLFPKDRLLVEMGIDGYLGTPLFNKSGRALGIMVLLNEKSLTNQKISESTLQIFSERVSTEIQRKQAQDAIVQLEEFNKSILNGMAEGVVVQDADGIIEYVNIATRPLLGYTEDELLGQDWTLIIPEDQRSIVRAFDKQRMQGKKSIYDLKLRRNDGQRIDVMVSGSPRFKDGKFIGTIGVFTDITEQKMAVEELRGSEERYRSILDNMEEGYYEVDLKGNFTFFNESLCKMLNYSPDKLMGMNNRQYMESTSAKRIFKIFNEMFRTMKSTRTVDIKIKRKEGRINFAEISISLLKDKNNNPVGFRGIVRDINERKQAEEQLKENEEKYRNLFHSKSRAAMLIDAETLLFEDANQKALDLFGYSRDEFLRLTPIHLTAEKEKSEEALLNLLESKTATWHIPHRKLLKKDGNVFDSEIYTGMIKIKERDKILSLVHDITERKQLEEQLQQAQKSEAIGQLAGGLAHDFNNLLGAIIGYCEISLLNVKEESSVSKNLNSIIKRSQQGAKLVSQLLAYSRQHSFTDTLINLNNVVNETVQFLRHVIGEDIDLTMELDPTLATIKADPTALNQIITNLCLNARDAMPEGGKLKIRTLTVKLDEKFRDTHLGAALGNCIKLEVTDTGIGMDEETQRRIFDPFFTTKEKWEGAGLGLSMVHGIVKQHNGYIDCTSVVGKGTTFELYFPIIIAPAEKEARSDEQKMKRGNETILLVEDDPDVLQISRMILEKTGYRVLTASDGKEALKKFKKNQTKIDLVITDIILPMMSGVILHKKIQGINPGIKFLFVSGYTGSGIYKKYHLEPDMELLQKPFRSSEITAKVRKIIDK